MAKQSNTMKIVAFSLVLLFLISGFSYSIYQNQQSSTNERQMLSPYTPTSELPIMGKSHATGVPTGYVSNYNIGTSEIQNNTSFELGNVNSSYLGEIYVPVYLDGSAVFRNLVQVFSYDSNLLKFNGTINDVASQNISFSYSSLAPDVFSVHGNGTFEATYSTNILYYLVFTPEVTQQVKTSIILDYSVVGNSTYSTHVTSIINIVRGWTNLGPSNIYTGQNLSSSEAGTASAIGYSPSNMSLLYLGSGAGGPHASPGDHASHVVGFGGLYRSTNFGKTWQSVDFGLGAASVEDIAVNPADPNIVVVITRGLGYPVGGDVFKTVNGGLSWQETYDIGGYNLQYVDGVLYAATFYGLIKSYNFGSTWELVKTFTGLVTTATVAGNGSVIYVGLWYQARNQTTSAYVQILKSTNGGESFSLIFNLTRSTSTVSQILIDPSNGSVLWALVDGGLSYPDIFKSVDGGAQWELLNLTQVGVTIPVDTYTNPGHPLYFYPQYIAIDPMNSSNMYLGGDGYFYESHNGGQMFSYVPQTGGDVRFINIDPANDSIIFVGSDQGLIASVDGGVKWFTMNNRSASLLYDVAVSGDKIFTTAQDFSPIYSPDLGFNWSTINRGELGFVSTDPYNSSVIVMWTENHANGHFLFVSNDGGKIFFLPSLNYSYLPNQFVGSSSSGVAFTSGSTMFLPGGSGVLVSYDYGKNWSLIPNSPRNCFFISISQSNQNILFCTNYSGLFESTNGGNTWFDTNAAVYGSNLSPFPVFQSLAIDPDNSSIIVAEQYLPSLNYSTSGISLYSQVFISINGGKSFTYTGENSHDRFASPPQLYFYMVHSIPTIVYTCDQGIFVSFDVAKVWQNYTFNLDDPVVTSLDLLLNGSAYISTYGSGVWYDPSLFNFTFLVNPPLLTGYIPLGMNLTVNGVRINTSGYFSIELRQGNNSIWDGKQFYINARDGQIYFINLENVQIALSLKQEGLLPGTEWKIGAAGNIYNITGNASISLPLGTRSVYVFPVRFDYSIYYPVQDDFTLNLSLFSSLTVQFKQVEILNYENITSNMTGNFWTTEIASNHGYAVYGGGGDALLLNISTLQVKDIGNPFPNGQVFSVAPFSNGFIMGGALNSSRPGLFYYNISSGRFTNLSIFPSQWNGSYARISTVFSINATSFGFIGGASGKTFFGIMDDWRFRSLSQYIPEQFNYSGTFTHSAGYLSKDNSIILSNGNDIGIFYLNNSTFVDISAMFPSQFSILPPYFSPSSAFISSNGTTALIVGSTSSGNQFVAVYSPGSGYRDISNLFPASVMFDSVRYSGRDFVLAGAFSSTSQGNKPSIFLYNGTMNAVTPVQVENLNSSALIDSALIVGNTIFYTTFNMKNLQYYSVLSSYYGKISLTPTGTALVNINVPAYLTIGNFTYFGSKITVYDFSGSYNISIYSKGYENWSGKLDIEAFKTAELNVSLTKLFNITFSESGLPSGTSWSVTLNGTTQSSSTNTITFNEPNGSYSYTIGIYSGYSASPYSGTVTVNGGNVNVPVTFKRVTYSVTFTESGLPSGTAWYVNISNGQSYKSTGTEISLNEPNGTYSYVISSSNKSYSPNPSSGSFTVNGSTVSQSITFSQIIYTITFTESGLPSGTSWSVTLNNVTETSTNSTITFHESYGIYSYSISLPSGYRTATSTGSITTTQPSLNIPISVSSTAPSSSQTNYPIYIAIAIVMIAAVIGTVVAMGRRKK